MATRAAGGKADGPTHQPVEHLVARGGYVLRDPLVLPVAVVLLATGSEVSTALGAADLLEAAGVGARVVLHRLGIASDQVAAAAKAAIRGAPVTRSR